MYIDVPTLHARLEALQAMAKIKADLGGIFSYDAGRV